MVRRHATGNDPYAIIKVLSPYSSVLYLCINDYLELVLYSDIKLCALDYEWTLNDSNYKHRFILNLNQGRIKLGHKKKKCKKRKEPSMQER